jgi:hypothetical protein
MSVESRDEQPSWLTWEKGPVSDNGQDYVGPESWRTDSQGWTLLETLPNLAESVDSGHNFLADTGVEYSVQIDRADVERALGVPLTTADWRASAVRLDTSAVLSAREMFAKRLAAAWLKHLASGSTN